MNELWSSQSPGLNCLSRGHILTERSEPLLSGKTAEASWCLWCVFAVTNEHEAGWECDDKGVVREVWLG